MVAGEVSEGKEVGGLGKFFSGGGGGVKFFIKKILREKLREKINPFPRKREPINSRLCGKELIWD